MTIEELQNAVTIQTTHFEVCKLVEAPSGVKTSHLFKSLGVDNFEDVGVIPDRYLKMEIDHIEIYRGMMKIFV